MVLRSQGPPAANMSGPRFPVVLLPILWTEQQILWTKVSALSHGFLLGLLPLRRLELVKDSLGIFLSGALLCFFLLQSGYLEEFQ